MPILPYLDYAPYLVSKGAVPALTRCLAVELGTRNPRVRVNCVLPGPVLFPPDMPGAEREEAIRSTLVRRAGRPENVAAAVLFLVENEFVTGVCLPVDGGRTIYAADGRSQGGGNEDAIRVTVDRRDRAREPCRTTRT